MAAQTVHPILCPARHQRWQRRRCILFSAPLGSMHNHKGWSTPPQTSWPITRL